MSKNNIKDIEILYFIKSFLKKDFPRFMSKSFSTKIMKKINDQPRTTYFQYFTRLAIASSFAVVTLILVQVMTIDNYNYTNTTISKTKIKAPTYNTSNQQLDNNCKDHNNKKADLDGKKCE